MGPSPTDPELLTAWQGGASSAGETLFERYYPVAERFFHNKVLDPCEREDLIQTTFLECVESAARFRGTSSFRTFLLGIATHIWLSRCRRAFGPRNHAALGSMSVEDMGQTPSDVIADDESKRMMLAALRSVPLQTQVLLELRYWEGLKLRELAEVLEIPDSTVKNRLLRAKQVLEQQMERLARSGQALDSTMTTLEGWAARVRKLDDAS
ncbi:MAG: sigma-70 family RNA polymerase sigma factor [Myxococcota bacterium]